MNTCAVCGKNRDDCSCPICPQCNRRGDPSCYKKHGLDKHLATLVDSLIDMVASGRAIAKAKTNIVVSGKCVATNGELLAPDRFKNIIVNLPIWRHSEVDVILDGKSYVVKDRSILLNVLHALDYDVSPKRRPRRVLLKDYGLAKRPNVQHKHKAPAMDYSKMTKDELLKELKKLLTS